MRVSGAVRIGWESAKANVVPTVVLWAFAFCLVLLYYLMPGASACFEQGRKWQEAFGWKAVAASRILFNGLIPGVFLLCVAAIRPRRPFLTIFAQAVFGCAFGLLCDAFFRMQSAWFGSGTELLTLVLKTLVDQFVWTVLIIAPVNAVFFFWVAATFAAPTEVDDLSGDGPVAITADASVADISAYAGTVSGSGSVVNGSLALGTLVTDGAVTAWPTLESCTIADGQTVELKNIPADPVGRTVKILSAAAFEGSEFLRSAVFTGEVPDPKSVRTRLRVVGNDLVVTFKPKGMLLLVR